MKIEYGKETLEQRKEKNGDGKKGVWKKKWKWMCIVHACNHPKVKCENHKLIAPLEAELFEF